MVINIGILTLRTVQPSRAFEKESYEDGRTNVTNERSSDIRCISDDDAKAQNLANRSQQFAAAVIGAASADVGKISEYGKNPAPHFLCLIPT